MEEKEDTLYRTDSIIEANKTSHYVLITIAVIIGMIGIMLRFLGHGFWLDLIANIIWIIGILIALKAVADILQD